jgi:predicted RNase H-like HicB family nuclease
MHEELHIDVRIEDGSLWATVDELPGVFATGDTSEELRASLEEGISLYLAKPDETPHPVTLDEFDSAVASARLARA